MLAQGHETDDGDDRLTAARARLSPERKRAKTLDHVELVAGAVVGRNEVQVEQEPVRAARDGQRELQLGNRTERGQPDVLQDICEV